MLNREKLDAYFAAFSAKDTAALKNMFATGVTLNDWNVSVSGKNNVAAEVQKIFDSVDTITVTPIATYEMNDLSFAVKIAIQVHSNESYEQTLDVIDVITFNESGLIKSVAAYKG